MSSSWRADVTFGRIEDGHSTMKSAEFFEFLQPSPAADDECTSEPPPKKRRKTGGPPARKALAKPDENVRDTAEREAVLIASEDIALVFDPMRQHCVAVLTEYCVAIPSLTISCGAFGSLG